MQRLPTGSAYIVGRPNGARVGEEDEMVDLMTQCMSGVGIRRTQVGLELLFTPLYAIFEEFAL
jgi:hypothetical protein